MIALSWDEGRAFSVWRSHWWISSPSPQPSCGPSVSFPAASDEKTTSHRTSLPKVMQCSNVLPEPKPSALPLEQARCRMLLSEYHPRECRFQKNHTQLLSERLTHSWVLFSPQVQMLNFHQIQKFWTKVWLNSLVSTSLTWNGQAVFEVSCSSVVVS